jgi:hypothetical protein
MNKLHRNTVEFALLRTFKKPERELKMNYICGLQESHSILFNLHIYVAL